MKLTGGEKHDQLEAQAIQRFSQMEIVTTREALQVVNKLFWLLAF
jgi:hypothetical protein